MAHGTGSGRDAAAYLLAEKDHKHEQRAGVEVLRGNPVQLGELIDSLHFVQRYTSGVIAFAPEDKPSREDVDKLLTQFEKTAFAGLEGNQYSWAAVRHDEPDGACHVHVIAARVELQSGKSLNIAPPGWENTFDHLRDAWNYEKGWARPDDPLRARLAATNIKDIHRLESPKEAINEWLTSQMASGLISGRKGVLEALEGIGTINRVNPRYISVILEEGQKPIRLKGAIYAEQFSVGAILEAHSAARSGQGRDSSANREAAENARRELNRAIEKRVGYNQERYGRSLGGDQRGVEASRPANTQSLGAPLRSLSELVPFDRAGDHGMELVAGQGGAAESGRSRSGGSGNPEVNGRPNDEVLQHASGQSELHWEQEVNEPNRKPKPKPQRQLDRERTDGILEAISRFTAASRQNLESIGDGAEQRTHTNERPTDANQYVGRVCEAVRQLADGINQSFGKAREFARAAWAEIIASGHSHSKDHGHGMER